MNTGKKIVFSVEKREIDCLLKPAIFKTRNGRTGNEGTGNWVTWNVGTGNGGTGNGGRRMGDREWGNGGARGGGEMGDGGDGGSLPDSINHNFVVCTTSTFRYST